MLEAAFSDRTRLVVLNNPINPAGVVLPREDLVLLAEFCMAHDAVAICDEVWEQVKDGSVRGFSIEGVFDHISTELSKDDVFVQALMAALSE
jgi:aspartate/methionine/tyrosine aminotransferase